MVFSYVAFVKSCSKISQFVHGGHAECLVILCAYLLYLKEEKWAKVLL